jgi:hypothetical protein
MRIELTTSAWKAEVLPLNYTRISYLINLLLHNTHKFYNRQEEFANSVGIIFLLKEIAYQRRPSLFLYHQVHKIRCTNDSNDNPSWYTARI